MSCRSLRRRIAALVLLFCGLAAQASDPNVLIVDLVINHQRTGDEFVLRDKEGNFYLPEKVLQHWKIARPWPDSVRFRSSNFYRVDGFSGATAEFDSHELSLQVSLPPSLMPLRSVDMNRGKTDPQLEEFGLFLDYELNWLSYDNARQQSMAALLQPVAFGRFGNISASTIYRRHSGNDPFGGTLPQSGLNILELMYTRDDPERMRSLRIGDVFTNPGSISRSLRVGGIQIGTNFETQPTFITHPLPRFFGEASVPTALDVYVNGQLRQRENVEPGSYVLEDVPVVNGAGQLQVVARDALGRQQIFTQDFYSSTELLKEGLDDYSLTIGTLRESYGLENFQYGDFVAAGNWRRGLRPELTIEGHAEMTSGLGMLGGAARYALPAGGIVRVGLGASTTSDGAGAAWSIGFRQQLDVINYSIDLKGTTSRFRTIGDLEPPPKFELFSSAGRNFFEYGSVGLSLVHREFHSRPKQTIFSANHSKSFRNALTLTAFASYIRSGSDDVSLGIRFSMPFGESHYAGSSISRRRGQSSLTADIHRSLPRGNGYAYRLGVGMLDDKYIDAGISLQSQVGNYALDIRGGDGSGSVWQAAAKGSIAYLAGMTRFSRSINNAFAVVNVGNVEGVRVYAENIEIGRTDENGQIFVPGLQPYSRNQLRVELEDLPLTARVGESSTVAAPYAKSGVVVNFDVRLATNVILRAILPDGQPLPEGAVARVFPSNDKFPVGIDGKLYLQGIDRSSEIRIRWSGKTCSLDVPYPRGGSAVISKLGDIVCVPESAND